jgi:hypothetical protein
MKVFDNREGFLGLFDRAELQIYSYVTATTLTDAGANGALTLADLLNLPDEAARRQKLLERVLAETDKFAQSRTLEINGVKDNQTLLFGDAGLVIYQSETIPERLAIQLWVIEADGDVRKVATDADKVLDSDAFKGLFAAMEAALAITNPLLTGVIAVGGVVTTLLRQLFRTNKDDLVGYWQTSLLREQDYPHGARDRQDVYDTTGNILVDYTLFGFENVQTQAPDQAP